MPYKLKSDKAAQMREYRQRLKDKAKQAFRERMEKKKAYYSLRFKYEYQVSILKKLVRMLQSPDQAEAVTKAFEDIDKGAEELMAASSKSWDEALSKEEREFDKDFDEIFAKFYPQMERAKVESKALSHIIMVTPKKKVTQHE